ncbi:DUF881 domain-containing protein [Paraclostridium bifermentans]|uniref:DUF881 domain-containing protein n=1 Tax=Paraclostridium bifermentans TaxID=1490 RepID=UPI00359C8F60
MKKPYMLIIVVSVISGIFVGYMMKKDEFEKNSFIVKDEVIYENIKEVNESIERLNKEKEKLYKELNNFNETYLSSSEINTIETMKANLSYTDIYGKGIEVVIDAENDEAGNIANLIDYNNILINTVNDLKSKGGKYISINNQRINQYTAIILAGNHININFIPIAPPYNIKVIGDIEKLKDYKTKSNYYIKNLTENYPINITVSEVKNISMNKMEIQNNLDYIKESR